MDESEGPDDRELTNQVSETKKFTKTKAQQIDTSGAQPWISDLDQRRRKIFETIEQRKATSSPSLLQKAEAVKVGIERQLEDAQKAICDLLGIGNQLASNVKVSNQRREALRIKQEFEQRERLKKDLENESIESLAKINDITAKWTELKTIKEPTTLFHNIEEQKKRVMEIMAQKDGIIKQCQKEINRMNDIFNAEMVKQKNDINVLVTRTQQQIELLNENYKQHLRLLEATLQDERHNIELEAASKWKTLSDELIETENKNHQIVKEKEMFYARELQRICAAQEEITRSSRIRLEKDSDQLQWELVQLKSSILMISEKLDYNYQVLQKRNDENVVINNQQKRRVGRLIEGISQVKKKVRDVTFNTEIQINKVTTNIHKLHMNIGDLEKKSIDFRHSNQEKYRRITCINIKEIEKVLTNVFEIDRILHEHQLNVPWKKPDISFECYKPTPRKSYLKAILEKQRPTVQKTHITPMEDVAYSRMMRNILRQIADRAGFLVEDKLLRILEPYKEDEKCIVRLDNIFTALRITEPKNISRLISFFVPYCWCPNCNENSLPDSFQKLFTIGHDFRRSTLRTSLSTDELSSDVQPPKKNINCREHRLVIEPTLVLTALKQFTREHSISNKINYEKHRESRKSSVPKVRSADAIKAFLMKLDTCVPENKVKLWNTLEHGLIHFLEVLKQRQQLDNECKFLRRQNQELKHIFQKFNV